jgi:hypothetical protein
MRTFNKRNPSNQRKLIYQSGKTVIPSIIIKAQNQNQTQNEKLNQNHNQNPLKENLKEKIKVKEIRDIKDIRELNNSKFYKENQINNNNHNNNTIKSQFVNEYLSLIRCSYPYCNCGNCIMKKNREYSTGPNYNYHSNIKSNYQKEFDWKKGEKLETFKNAKLSHFDKGFKEHIKPGLESVMHKDYNYKVLNTSNNYYKFGDYLNTNNTDTDISIDNNTNNNNNKFNIKNEKEIIKRQKNKDNKIQMNVPFLGRSSYNTQFPHWNAMIDLDKKESKLNKKPYMGNEVPFTGKSSYMETYGNFEDKYYKEKTNPVLKRDNLEVGFGNMICHTSSGDTYRPLDYKMAKDLNRFDGRLNNLQNLRSAPFSKDCFLSSYERAFMDNGLIKKKI